MSPVSLLAVCVVASPISVRAPARDLVIGTGARLSPGPCIVTVHYRVEGAPGRMLADSERRGVTYRVGLGGEGEDGNLFESLRGMRIGGVRQLDLHPVKWVIATQAELSSLRRRLTVKLVAIESVPQAIRVAPAR